GISLRRKPARQLHHDARALLGTEADPAFDLGQGAPAAHAQRRDRVDGADLVAGAQDLGHRGSIMRRGYEGRSRVVTAGGGGEEKDGHAGGNPRQGAQPPPPHIYVPSPSSRRRTLALVAGGASPASAGGCCCCGWIEGAGSASGASADITRSGGK